VILVLPLAGCPGKIAADPVKSGRTSAPRLPQALQTNRGSRSDSRSSPGSSIRADRDGMAAVIVCAVDQHAANALFAWLVGALGAFGVVFDSYFPAAVSARTQ
jgi:hypothetical protein